MPTRPEGCGHAAGGASRASVSQSEHRAAHRVRLDHPHPPILTASCQQRGAIIKRHATHRRSRHRRQSEHPWPPTRSRVATVDRASSTFTARCQPGSGPSSWPTQDLPMTINLFLVGPTPIRPILNLARARGAREFFAVSQPPVTSVSRPCHALVGVFDGSSRPRVEAPLASRLGSGLSRGMRRHQFGQHVVSAARVTLVSRPAL